MDINPENRPHFFKIMFGGLNSQKLRIPPKFMKHISKDLSDRANLKGPSGSVWNVKLNSDTGYTYIQDGWEEFRGYHSIGDNEFLVFRYDGDMCFNVQVFDKSGCERTYMSISKQHQQSAPLTVKRKPGRPRKRPLPLQLCGDAPEASKERDSRKKIKEEEMDLPVLDMDAGRHLSSEEHPPSGKGRGRSKKSEAARAKVLKEATSFTSKNPYFIHRIKQACLRNGHALNVPLTFARTHLPQRKSKMVLRNHEGKSFAVKSNAALRRHYFYGGWSDFAAANNLKQGDVCIFELVAEYKMEVHVFSR